MTAKTQLEDFLGEISSFAKAISSFGEPFDEIENVNTMRNLSNKIIGRTELSLAILGDTPDPKPGINEAAVDILDPFLDFEAKAVDLKHMAYIASNMVEEIFSRPTRTENDGRLVFIKTRRQIDAFMFASFNVSERADALREAFDEAYREATKTGAPA